MIAFITNFRDWWTAHAPWWWCGEEAIKPGRYVVLVEGASDDGQGNTRIDLKILERLGD